MREEMKMKGWVMKKSMKTKGAVKARAMSLIL
jgi:hypothetical protein